MKKKKIFGIERKEFVRKEIKLIIVLALLIIIILSIRMMQKPIVGKAFIIETEHITAMVSVPDVIYANQEFVTNIDLDISGIENSILVTAYIPEGLEINTINPSNGMFVEDTIIWILEPADKTLSFTAVGTIGTYELKVKFGTYDNENEISEENSTMVMFNITEAPADKCVSGSDCSARFGEAYECINGNCINICENVDCNPGMACVNQGGTPVCMP